MELKQSIQRFFRGSKYGVYFLCFLVIAELVTGVWLWVHTKPTAEVGFVVKVGPSYLLAWKENQTYYHEKYDSLAPALEYASHSLGLEKAKVVSPILIEHLWLDERVESYVVFWTFEKNAFLNHMTFMNEKEAKYFADAFKTGSYSPSPFGHSIVLKPTRN